MDDLGDAPTTTRLESHSPGRSMSSSHSGSEARVAARYAREDLMDGETRPSSFGSLLGVAPNGVPVFSNGRKGYYSATISETPNLRLPMDPLLPSPTRPADLVTLGTCWDSVEFVRRYMAMSKAVWLAAIPTPEDAWFHAAPLTLIATGAAVPLEHHENGMSSVRPQRGDILVWGRSLDTSLGHVAVVTDVTTSSICIAEQSYGTEMWPPGRQYSRELPVVVAPEGGAVRVGDDESLLGWLHVVAPLANFKTDDIPDNFRHILTSGTICRHSIDPDVSGRWLDPTDRCDFFLKRSLMVHGNMGEGAMANPDDVPNGYYTFDYDMWSRIRCAANSLHDIAMEATHRVLSDPSAESLLMQYFGIPRELHGQLRRSLDVVPAMGGRFDFGYDGKRIVMLEYNCDSSAALLECCSTQEKWARYHGITAGTSAGSFLRSRIVAFFKRLLLNDAVCPRHKLVHFMIDDDDEERYTALCVMGCAQEAGFRCKLCVKLMDFKYAAVEPSEGDAVGSGGVGANTAPLAPPGEHPPITDLENEEVLLVWKTWSWDTILHQFTEQQRLVEAAATAAALSVDGPGLVPPPRKPTLSDILLNDRIRVLEPLWKAVTGSKAILPFMYLVAPEQPNMVPASFLPVKEIISKHHLSKPVNGRAGQNICMYDPVTDRDAIRDAPELTLHSPLLSKAASTVSFGMSPNMGTLGPNNDDCANESSTGRFVDSPLVYQRRVFLKKFDERYFPIFCGWMIGNQFSGVVVREDTSKITKLNSRVIPARVLRSTPDVIPEGAPQQTTAPLP